MLEDALPGEAVVEAVPLPDAIQKPTARRLSVIYLAGVLAGGNLLGNVLRMAGGLLQNRYVKPEVLGTFNGIGLVLGFALPAVGRLEWPESRTALLLWTKRSDARARAGRRGEAWAMALGVIVGIPFLGMAAWLAFHGDLPMAAGWFANGLLAFVFFYATMYLPSTYRTAHDFARLSTVNVVQNAVALVCVLAVVCWGFYGLCLRATIPVLVGLWILRRWQPIRVGPVWSFRHLHHLLVVGLPIFAVGELGGPLWILIDQKLVQHYLDARGLGLYSMVLVVGGTMDLLPQAFSQVIYPRMSEHYGRTHNLAEIMLMAVRPTIMLVAGMLAVVALGWWLARPLTAWLLPNFVDAVPAMQWSLLGSVAISFCMVFNVYNVARRQDLYGIVQVASIGSYFLSLMWLIRNGADLAAFPKAMLVGKTVFAVAGLALLIPVYLQHGKA